MYDVRLVINGRMFPVYHRHLLAIAEKWPEGGESSRELVKALVALGVPSIAKNLLKAESAGSILSREDLDEFWAMGDADIRRCLVENWDFLERLSDEQAQDILDADDPAMMKSMAGKARALDFARKGNQNTRLSDRNVRNPVQSLMSLLWRENPEARLSDRMADALLGHIANSRYPEIRQTLEHAYSDMHPRFRPSFRECLESGFDMEEVSAAIQPEDVELLNTAPVETLDHIAYHLGRIRNDEARRAVGRLLAAHPDPCVRFELATWAHAPRPVLELLLKDADLDVSGAARRSLDRANDETHGELRRHLSTHPDPDMRLIQAQDIATPRDVLERLLEDADPDVRQAARGTLDDKEGENHD